MEMCTEFLSHTNEYPAKYIYNDQGCGVGVVGSRRFLGGVGVGILRVLGVGIGVRIFDPTPTPKVQLN